MCSSSIFTWFESCARSEEGGGTELLTRDPIFHGILDLGLTRRLIIDET